jgi:hypothetical protein
MTTDTIIRIINWFFGTVLVVATIALLMGCGS